MGVETAMGQADLFHDLGDARAVVPSSPSSARGGRDDPFVGDFLAAGGGSPGGGSAHYDEHHISIGRGAQDGRRRTAGDRRAALQSCPFWARTRTLLIQREAG